MHCAPLTHDDLIEQLLHCSARLKNRTPVIHDPGEIGISKSYPSKRRVAQNVARGRLPIFAEEKSRLRIQIGVAPPVQDDACNITLGVETGPSKHLAQLL